MSLRIPYIKHQERLGHSVVKIACDHAGEPQHGKASLDIRHGMPTRKRNDNSMPYTSEISKTVDRSKLGRHLKEGIRSQGYSFTEFASLLGISKQSLYCYFTGSSGLSLERAIAICDLLDWPLDKLACRREEEPWM